jgi:molybdate transport system ATP-binding protein
MIQARIVRNYAPGPDSAGFLLEIEFSAAGGITVLFGPSGSGKTLTLDCIAGFVRPDTGRILLDDEILFDAAAGVNLPPQRRHCGYVFQNYALFPHMTLRENLVFAADRQPRLERHRKVTEMLERFHLAAVSGRRPHELSGGEKQRCSIARALIGGPRLLLLDEPARGLDAPLRSELYTLLRQVRSDFHIPILLVTHDLDECFELGDEMIVLYGGRLVQSGAPRRVLDQPASPEVARLLNIPNLLRAEIIALDPGRNTSRLKVLEHELNGPYFPGHLLGDRVWLCVRPEQLHALPQNGSHPQPNQVPAVLVRVSEKAQWVRLEFEGYLTVEMPREQYDLQKDNRDWRIEFPPNALRIL